MTPTVTRPWMRDHWWTFLLRGLAAILFGVLALLLPGLTIAALVLLFGAFALVEGLIAVVGALRGRHRDWGWHLVDGLIGIAIGIVTVFWPGLTAIGLLYAIAFWAILTGVMRLAIAIRLRDLAGHPWFLGLMGLVSVAAGIILILAPVAGALAIVWLIGFYAIIIGALFVGLAFRVRSASA